MIAFNNQYKKMTYLFKMKKILNKIKQFFEIKCTHAFLLNDVRNLSKDPECVYCKKKLSDFKN